MVAEPIMEPPPVRLPPESAQQVPAKPAKKLAKPKQATKAPGGNRGKAAPQRSLTSVTAPV